MIQQTLQELGFHEKEIELYLVLLPLGSSTATVLGKRTGIQRSTAKYSLDKLVEKGIVSMVEKNNTFIYTAENPQKILQNLELQKQEVEDKMSKVGRIVSELENMLHPASALPKVRFFEGKEGYIEFCEESLQCKNKEILFLTNMDYFRSIVTTKYDTEKYIPTRLKRKIFLRLLTVKSDLTEEMHQKDLRELRETRFLLEKFFIKNTIFIFDDITTLVSNETYPSCIMIQSKEITDTMRTVYECMWSSAKK